METYSEQAVIAILNIFAKYANDEIGRMILPEDTNNWFNENIKPRLSEIHHH
ncbi:MAG: hypothetical protein V4549_07665 [Bacteroidota bacterium]